ncbi:MAG: patatin-like phospholipase family protein [Pseudolabrys sp.]
MAATKQTRSRICPKAPKRINLALQGGGAHGAFTWGVIDHLLEDGRLTVEGISGTSAGAVNAVMLADGLKRGGPEEARKRLADFWRAASLGGELPAVQRRRDRPPVLAVAERGFALVQLAVGVVAVSFALRSQSA